jgi:hypothetical protein
VVVLTVPLVLDVDDVLDVPVMPVPDVSVMPVADVSVEVMPVSVLIVSVDIVIDVSVLAEVMEVSVAPVTAVSVEASMFVSSFLQETKVRRVNTDRSTRSFLAITFFLFLKSLRFLGSDCIQSRLGVPALTSLTSFLPDTGQYR